MRYLLFGLVTASLVIGCNSPVEPVGGEIISISPPTFDPVFEKMYVDVITSGPYEYNANGDGRSNYGLNVGISIPDIDIVDDWPSDSPTLNPDGNYVWHCYSLEAIPDQYHESGYEFTIYAVTSDANGDIDKKSEDYCFPLLPPE